MPGRSLMTNRATGRIIGLRKLNQSAAEIYKVKDEYKRFNQKDNMVWQPSWNTNFKGCGLGKIESQGIEKVRKKIKGFSSLDWAFLYGAHGNVRATNFPNNIANRGGNSWNPLGLALPEGVERWEGDESKAALIIQKMAYLFGADMVGICRLDRRWVYSHYFNPEKMDDYPIMFSDQGYDHIEKPTVLENGTAVIPASMKNVIVLIHEMDYDGIRTAPAMAEHATVRHTYSKMAFTGINMSEFIRGLGYNAIPSANCTALSVPLAIEAGLGQLGRHGKLISPVFGSRCRISKVITDLPLETDSPIEFGVTTFCGAGKICAEGCPSKAISYGERSYEPAGNFSNGNVLKWQVKQDKCRTFQSKHGSNCGLCIARCPYNRKPGFKHWALTSLAASFPALNKLQLKLTKPKLLDSDEFWEQ